MPKTHKVAGDGDVEDGVGEGGWLGCNLGARNDKPAEAGVPFQDRSESEALCG